MLEPETWDARAEFDVGLMIGRYLAEHPAPEGSTMAPRLEVIAQDLRDLGEQRLQNLGRCRLRAVGPPA
jgi:hypothetical protein